MTEEELSEIWKGDLLGFKERGVAFTNLITSITDHRTISIEAGYGRGKTFFREAWAKQLEAVGECVVQIDARLSDHSGDPVVTFLGALLGMVPEQESKRRDAAFGMAKKIGIAGARAIGKAALREGFDELADAVAQGDRDAGSLHDIAKTAGQDLSKVAGDMIATQLEAEKARLELGEQLKLLHKQIIEGRDTDRIIILIDELDRCHPDYAIALLEAMKLVFDQDGFVFVLMVNRGYLEAVAEKRFGKAPEDESYLDKFVDLRLKLETDLLSNAAEALASDLPLAIPFGVHEEFTVARAAELAGQLAPESGLSMRQIKRVLERVELACLIYAQRPVDVSLLVWLAFSEPLRLSFDRFGHILPKRFDFMSSSNVNFGMVSYPKKRSDLEGWASERALSVRSVFPELSRLNLGAFKSLGDHNYYRSVELLDYLTTKYIPEHQAMLDAVHKLQADA
ncbi:P-loop NTPase fold protein [uncultured Sulfitobacter sp.]|uniref:KAP family P-loop NTPase fold protein n=1 Tax=uncultured Sulfitobacter sp. TaxID=191468 RepID=UPI0030D7DB98